MCKSVLINYSLHNDYCKDLIIYKSGRSIYDSPSECYECKWHSWNRVHARRYRNNYEQMLVDGLADVELIMETEQKAVYFEKRVEQYEMRRDLIELVV